MTKADLINLLNRIFAPLGFKRKGNNWTLNNGELTKILNLQKSNYSNLYYLNYGFIINGLELTTITHVENRLAGASREEQKIISELLDFEIDMPDEIREEQIKNIIRDKVLIKLQRVDTRDDLLMELKSRQHLNDIPLVVLNHFKIEIP